MSKRINMNPSASVQGGVGIGVMTASGNPWTVSDAFADDLVNRKLATYLDLQLGEPVPARLSQSSSSQFAIIDPYGGANVLVETTPYVQKTATGIVFSGACEYAGYEVVALTASPTLTIYDGTDTSGALILPATTLILGRFERNFKLALTNGCYVAISGTATINVFAG